MISGKILRDAIISGANNINNQRSRVDELNVFPVPDGDTGTNMGMTVGAAVRELQAMDDSCTVGEAAKTAASAMLRGARGNSGVITSLLFRGFSKALEGKKEADAADIVAALQKGVEGAYKAVMKPTEGTILTVARIASEEAAACGKEDVAELWDVVMTAGQKALEDTPNLLPVLKKAGVVDAGGQGIMIIFEGMGKVFHGEDIVAGGEAVPNKAKLSTENAGKGVFTDDLMKVEDIKNGYCTQFLINKNEGASAAKMRAFAESNGDSVVCIEDDDVINLHVHTADPGKILSEAIKYGYLTNFKIENMHEQFLARQKQGKSLEKQASAEKKPDPASEFIYAAVDPSRDYGFVAVAAGEGLKAVFTDLAADAVVSGGQTMNPATEDILAAIQSVPAKTVFVLPNNKNIIMAAEQAQKLADRQVVVLPTRTVPMGITALLNFDPSATVEANTAVDPSRDYGFVAVAAGEGLKAVFTDLAADAVVSGGQTMNPATEDILAAIQSVPAKTVFVLPNNKNIIMAAEQAQKLADRQVVVLPTRTVPMGITALLNFDPSATVEANTINMMSAADKVSTGLITYAARDSEYDGKRIKKGEIMALENGKIVSTSNDITKATYRLARGMCKKDSSFVTIISGCDVSDEDAEKVTEIVKAKCPNHVEVSHIRGGQPVYYYMISVE